MLAPVASAALVFAQPEIEVVVPAGAEHVWMEFPFHNDGDAPVVIDQMTASCGCTVPELAKNDFAPGEKGVLRVRFDIGTRQGLQTKQISVVTGEETTVLQFNANVPARLEIRPRLVLFRGEDIAPRSTTLEFLIDTPVTLLSVQSHNELYKVEATPAVDGQRYELEVTLLEKPDKDVRGTIRVRTRGASGREYTDVFFPRYLP